MESSKDFSGAESVSTRSSISPSPVSSSLGCPRRSPVWKYFTYDDFTGKSTCQVTTGDASDPGSSRLSPVICGKTFVGKYTSNLRTRSCHKECFHEVEKEEE